MCDYCGGWYPADRFEVLVSAKKVRCPECRGLNNIPKEDGNILPNIDGQPDWCPGFSGIVSDRQQNLFG